MMKKTNLDSLSIDQMWQLHEEISRLLSVRLTSEKRELEKRLDQLRHDKQVPFAEVFQRCERLAWCASAEVSARLPQVPKSSSTIRDMVWSRKNSAVADGGSQDGP